MLPAVSLPFLVRVRDAVADLCKNAASLTITALGIPVAILASRKVQKVLLAILVLDISLQVQKYFFLREDAAELGALAGLKISLTTIALVGLYSAWLIRLGMRCGSAAPPRRALNPVTLPATLLLLFSVVSLLAAGNTTLGLFEVCSVLERVLLYVYIANAISSREDALFILRVLMMGLVIQSVLMLAQAGGVIGDIDVYGFKARASFAGDSRISGTIGSPNTAAAYLAMNMAVALSIMLSGLRRADKLLAGAGLTLAILPMLFTLSRGGWISLLMSFMMLGIFGVARASRKTVGLAALIIIILVIPFSGAINDRLYGDDNGSSASRMPLNNLAFFMIKDHPILGVGANNFAVAMQPYLAHAYSGDFIYVVHNTYLLVWAETGTGGIIAFVWFLVASVRQGVMAWQMRDSFLALPGLGCAAAVVGAMVQMTVEPGRGGAAGNLLWLLAGLVTVLNRLSQGSSTVRKLA